MQFGTIREMSRKFGISELQIWVLIRNNLVPSFVIGNSIFITTARLQDYFKENPDNLRLWKMKKDERVRQGC